MIKLTYGDKSITVTPDMKDLDRTVGLFLIDCRNECKKRNLYHLTLKLIHRDKVKSFNLFKDSLLRILSNIDTIGILNK